MNQGSQHSVDLLRRIDAACDQFEAAWHAGTVPQIENYLALFRADERSALLTSLQSVQKELLRNEKGGEPLTQSKQLGKSTPFDQSDTSSKPPAQALSSKTKSDAEGLATTLVIDTRELESSSPDRRNHLNSKTPVDNLASSVTFHVIAGPHEGQQFTFQKYDTLLAGRISHAQLRLHLDRHFSRHHFRIEVNPPSCLLVDLGSRNGTYVNGEQVRDRYLNDGDIVSGGRTKIAVKIVDAKTTTTPNNVSDQMQATAAHVSGKPANVLSPRTAVVSTAPAGPSIETPVIHGYDLFEQIGAGDLGVVYRARRKTDGRLCALKVLSPAEQADEAAIEAFLRQVSVLNRFEHPHIVRLVDMGAAGRNVYFATEYAKSIDWARLADQLSEEKRIRIACGLMVQVLGALEYAHARSIVHRDIKPGNILILKQEKSLKAKLADFGLAKEYTMAGMSQMTRDGDVLGSLPFMSPDQFLNSRDARPTSDLYSAGATLYWMLTGHEPIPLSGYASKFLAILEAPPTPIREIQSAVPESLAKIVHRAIEKSPDKRYSTAAEMRHQLRSFLK